LPKFEPGIWIMCCIELLYMAVNRTIEKIKKRPERGMGNLHQRQMSRVLDRRLKETYGWKLSNVTLDILVEIWAGLILEYPVVKKV